LFNHLVIYLVYKVSKRHTITLNQLIILIGVSIVILIISMTNYLYPAIQGVEFRVLPKNSY